MPQSALQNATAAGRRRSAAAARPPAANLFPHRWPGADRTWGSWSVPVIEVTRPPAPLARSAWPPASSAPWARPSTQPRPAAQGPQTHSPPGAAGQPLSLIPVGATPASTKGQVELWYGMTLNMRIPLGRLIGLEGLHE